MKSNRIIVLTIFALAAVAALSSCSIREEMDDLPVVRQEGENDEYVEYTAAIAPAEFETKATGVDETPSTFFVGVYDASGTKVGVMTSSNSVTLLKSGIYSFYAVGGAISSSFTASSFPTQESGLASLQVMYQWEDGTDGDNPDIYIEEDGAPVYGTALKVTPNVLSLGGTVITVPVKRSIAKFNLSVKADAALRNYFTIGATGVYIGGYNLGFTPFAANGSAVEAPSDMDTFNFGAISSATMMSSSGGSLTLPIAENAQGDIFSGNSDPALKTESSESENATFIQLRVPYTGSNGVFGTMYYRFYLGSDNTTNCDVLGGKIYNVTCNLSYNGVFADAEWKVDTDAMTDSRALTILAHDHNTVKGDTLWFAVQYDKKLTAGSSVTSTYSPALGEVRVEKKSNAYGSDYYYSNLWHDACLGGSPGTVGTSYFVTSTANRRVGTCTNCGEKFYGLPNAGGGWGNNALGDAATSRFITESGNFKCPACKANFYSSIPPERYFLGNANGTYGAFTISGPIVQYGVPVPSGETASEYEFMASTYDGQHEVTKRMNLGPINNITIDRNVKSTFHVAQIASFNANVTKVAAASRSGMTFTATLAPAAGGSDQDVTSWLATSYNSSLTAWTLTLSAKAPGIVKIKAFLPDSSQIGETTVEIVNPRFTAGSAYIYLDGAESSLRHYQQYNFYTNDPAMVQMSVSSNASDEPRLFNDELYNELLNPSSISLGSSALGLTTRSTTSSIYGYYNPTSFWIKINSFTSSLRTLVQNNLHVANPKLTTYTITTPNGLTATGELRLYNPYSEFYFNTTTYGSVGVDHSDTDPTYIDFARNSYISDPSTLSLRWTWNSDSGNPNSTVNTSPTYDSTYHRFSVRISSGAVGESKLYLKVTNSNSSETIEYPIQNITVYSTLCPNAYLSHYELSATPKLIQMRISNISRNIQWNNTTYDVKYTLQIGGPYTGLLDQNGSVVPLWTNIIYDYSTGALGYRIDDSIFKGFEAYTSWFTVVAVKHPGFETTAPAAAKNYIIVTVPDNW